jgi:ferric-dicitrate binding protein FerR (iron transport regulator)
MLSVLLSMLLVVCPLLAADGQRAGEVKALIPAAARNDQPVNVKDALDWNDLLRTDAKGRLRAGLTDGSILSLGSNSELRVVESNAQSQQTSIDMNYGKLRNQVVKITKPGGKYEVKTPNAVIGVVGTDFYVSFAENRTTVICYVGKVAVTPAAGAQVMKGDNTASGSTNTVTVSAGQMVVIGVEVPPGGYQSSSTPAQLTQASMEDTNVPGQPVQAGKVGGHALRNTLIGVGAAAGLGVGLGIAETRGGGTKTVTANNPPTSAP